MPSPSRRPLTCLAVAVALVSGACTSSPTDGTSRSLTSTQSSTTTTRTPVSDPPPPTRRPPGTEATELLEFAVDPKVASGQDIRVARVGDVTLINAAGRLVALDADGVELWKIVERYTDIPTLEFQVFGPVAVVSRDAFGNDVFPGRLLVTGVDVATGRELWKNTTSAFVSFVGARMITSECSAKQTGKLGECTVTARDPRTGREQWQQKSYASARVTDPLEPIEGASSDELWVTSYPTGADSERTDAVRLSTGQRLGQGRTGDGFGTQELLVAPGLGVFFADDGTPADGGCTPGLAAVSVLGTASPWSREYTPGTYLSTDGKTLRCSRLDLRQQDEDTASFVLQGRPQLIDLNTGRTAWDHAKAGESMQAVTVDAVLTSGAVDGRGLVARARGDGRELWRKEFSVRSVTPGASDRSGPLLVEADIELTGWTLVLSPQTGAVQVAGLGKAVGHGDGWFATYVDELAARDYGRSVGVLVFVLP